jgi:hypothetical protein
MRSIELGYRIIECGEAVRNEILWTKVEIELSSLFLQSPAQQGLNDAALSMCFWQAMIKGQQAFRCREH